MRRFVPVVLSFVASAVVLAQRFPPVAPPNPNSSFAHRLGMNVAGYPVYGSSPGFRSTHPYGHRPLVVPFGGFYGGGYYNSGFYGDPYPMLPPPVIEQQASPTVIINQGFRPESFTPVLRDYSQVPLPEAAPQGLQVYENHSQPYANIPANGKIVETPAQDAKPPIYLIAFKDQSIVPAVAYWMEDGALHYVTMQHAQKRATLDLVDRELSQRLNDERHVEFVLR